METSPKKAEGGIEKIKFTIGKEHMGSMGFYISFCPCKCLNHVKKIYFNTSGILGKITKDDIGKMCIYSEKTDTCHCENEEQFIKRINR